MVGVDRGDRADWVDYAKAIGIILVVYGHVARGIFNSGIVVPVHAYEVLDSIVYSFHMPLFFFLSGLHAIDSLKRRGGAGMVLGKVDFLPVRFVVANSRWCRGCSFKLHQRRSVHE